MVRSAVARAVALAVCALTVLSLLTGAPISTSATINAAAGQSSPRTPAPETAEWESRCGDTELPRGKFRRNGRTGQGKNSSAAPPPAAALLHDHAARSALRPSPSRLAALPRPGEVPSRLQVFRC